MSENRAENDKSGFSPLSKAFKSDPTIENYVALRRKHPDEVIKVGISGGIEWLFANEDLLRSFNIPSNLVAGSLDADPDSISEFSLILMERLIERNDAEKEGKTHLASRGEAISDSQVNYLINMMLDSLDWNDDLFIPRDLIVLIRNQIGGGKDSAIAKRLKSHELEENAEFIGAQLLERGETVSLRKVASILQVNASTISRMYPGNTLIERSTKFLEQMKRGSKSETPFADNLEKRTSQAETE